MCLYSGHAGFTESIVWFGLKVFIFIWIVFVPIVITARLERIIKLLEEKK